MHSVTVIRDGTSHVLRCSGNDGIRYQGVGQNLGVRLGFEDGFTFQHFGKDL